jgi:hypothetical protein
MNLSFFFGTPVMSCPMLQSTLRKKNFYTTLLCGQALLWVTGFDASGGLTKIVLFILYVTST